MAAQVLRETIRELEKRRDEADRLKRSRLENVYKTAPRIKEIDERLNKHGVEVSRAILNGGYADYLIKDLSEENKALHIEKNEILFQMNYGNYLDDVYTCSLCKDSGYTDNNKRCTCFNRLLIQGYYKMSNLDNILKRENFDTFNMDLFSASIHPKIGVSVKSKMQKFYTIANTFVDNFNKEKKNLLLQGDSGLGKTFLCNCIAKALLDKGHSVIYFTSPQLFTLIEDVRFKKDDDDVSKDELLDMLPTIDLLVIDDLGAEFLTVVTAAELFNLINTRLLNGRHTIISTNYDSKALEDRYSKRVLSRLFGEFELLKFEGEDLRFKLKYKV